MPSSLNNIPPSEVTQLVRQLRKGDPDTAAKVIPFIYDELRRLAHGYLQRERPDHTLQPTALVHEAYLRLAQQKEVEWKDRSHFFGIAAHLMRQILVNYARARLTEKRGGGMSQLSLDAAEFVPQESANDLVALDELLDNFSRSYPRQSEVVEYKLSGPLAHLTFIFCWNGDEGNRGGIGRFRKDSNARLAIRETLAFSRA